MNSRVDIEFDQGTLILTGESAGQLVDQGLDVVRDDRIQAWRAPAISYRAILEWLVAQQIPYQDNARRYGKLDSLRFNCRVEPYEHQAKALEAWVDNGQAGVVVLPTGSGKTLVAQLAIEACRRDALVVVPTLDLLAQWVRSLKVAFDMPIGAIGGGEFTPGPITVITYDSAVRQAENLGDRFGLLIFDECHHLPGPAYSQAARMFLAPFRLGLTATPERADGGEVMLHELVGPLIFRQQVSKLAGEILAPYKVVRIGIHLTLEEEQQYLAARKVYVDFCQQNGVAFSRPDGWQTFLQKASRSPQGREALRAWMVQRNLPLMSVNKMLALSDLLDRHGGDRTLIFTHVNELAYRISRQFLIPVITHHTPNAERVQVLERFASGLYPAISTSKVLNEGVDVPDANVGIVLSGSSSVREHVQRLGRILRRKEGKEAVLYELVALKTHEERMSRARRKHEAYGGKRAT